MKAFEIGTQSLEGTHLIEASAGTGKTYSITFLVLRLLIEKGVPIDEILVVTFTEAASTELKEKIHERIVEASAAINQWQAKMSLPPGLEVYSEIFGALDVDAAKRRLKRALQNFDRAKVFTIHGFCQRLLKENAFETKMDFEFELVQDSRMHFATLARDFWFSYCDGCSALLVSFFKNNKLSPDNLTRLADLISSKPNLDFLTDTFVEDAEQSYCQAFYLAKEAFDSVKNRLESIISEAKGLNKRRYSKRYVPGWISKCETFFSPTQPIGVPDQDDVVFRFSANRMLEDAKEPFEMERHPFFDAVEALQTAASAMDQELQKLLLKFVEYVKDTLPKRKQDKGVIFFDDLLQIVHGALQGESKQALIHAVGATYRAALIDEFQDTDSIQYQIFRTLFQEPGIPFFIIGDPKQAIYSFRGGDIFTYMMAARSVAQNTSSLGVNWRSSVDLVRCVNELFGRQENSFLYREISFRPVLPSPQSISRYTVDGQRAAGFHFLFVRRDETNTGARVKDRTKMRLSSQWTGWLDLLCDDIIGLVSDEHRIDNEPIGLGDVAVLVRTNLQGRQVHDALLQRGVSSILSSNESVFQSPAAKELHQIMVAVVEGESAHIKTALSTIALGIKGEALVELSGDSRAQDQWQETFLLLNQRYSQKGLAAFIIELLHLEVEPGDGGLKARVLSLDHQGRYLVDFLQICELLQAKFGRRRLPLQQLVEKLGEQILDEQGDDTTNMRPVADSDGVQIVTMHKSKGLQYPVVYLPFAYKEGGADSSHYRLYHDVEADNVERCDFRSSVSTDVEQLCSKERFSEQMRLLYVALTRAKHVCKVMWGAHRNFERSSMGFLLHGPDATGVNKCDDAQLEADLQTFCDETDGAAVVNIPSLANRYYAEAVTQDAIEFQYRTFSTSIEAPPRTMSFSSMVHHKTPISNEPHEDTNIIDVLDIPQHQDTVSVVQAESDFDRGPVFGSFVHELFERVLIAPSLAAAKMDGLIDELALKYGFSNKTWIDNVSSWITSVLNTGINPSGSLCLNGQVGKCYVEMEFVMPVQAEANFCAKKFAAAMDIGANGDYREYTKSIASLPFSHFHGFLKGYIDLIFEHAGKWYVADYKTNYLCADFREYTQDAIAQNMAQFNYYLQYHIYTVALHRYLRQTLPLYDYDVHFGGTYYLYVRAMNPGAGINQGVFFDKPPKERITSLDRLFAGMEGDDNG